MPLNQMGLGFLFTAKDEASAVVQKIERSLGTLGKKSDLVKDQLVQGAIGATVTAGGVLALRGAFQMAKEAGEFQQALVDVKSISGATTGELKQLEGTAIAAGIATQFTPQQAVGGLRDLAAAGYNAQDSIKLLKPALDLAAGSLGELTPQQAAGVAAQTLKAFALSADDAALSVDKLLATANLFAVQTNELPALIGHVVRGAASYGASLDEALAASGLARNVLGNIELATTGVSVAMERLIKKDVQKHLKGIGVSVVNASGGFSQFLDVLTQMSNSPAFARMNTANKAGFINSAFGHHALGAVNAILVQLNGGIKTMTGETVKGAQAVKYLREQFSNAAGTARNFADARLDTLPGQLKLLEGSVATLRIVIGKELASVFRPIVEGVLNGVNLIMQAWLSLAPATRATVSKVLLGVAALVTAFGGFVLLKGSIVALGVVLGMLGTSLGALALSFAPIAIGMLALVGVGAAVCQAYKKNFGGFADVVNNAWKKISLAVRGIGQLFSSGEFSGDVMAEMDKAGNKGLKEFAITVFMWGKRLENFFRGLNAGFSEVSGELEPVFKLLLDAVGELASVLGISMGKANDNASSFDKFGQAGKDVGRVLVGVLAAGIRLLTWLIQALTIVVGAGKDAWILFGAAFGDAFDIIGGSLQMVFGLLQGNGSMFWRGFINLTFGAVKLITNTLYGLVKTFAYVSDWLNQQLGIKSSLTVAVQAEQDRMIGGLNESQQFWKREYGSGEVPQASAAAGFGPSARAAGAGGSAPVAVAAQEAERAAMARIFREYFGPGDGGKASAPGGAAPLQANLYVDGERLATAMAKAQRSSDSRQYQSVATEGAD